jgi:type III secretion system FlhB-like substrate exporter
MLWNTGSCHSCPHLTISNIIIFNGHAITSKTTKTFDPSVLERGDGLVEKAIIEEAREMKASI